jgi:dTDP-4-amino-4,6-dideoxygalactose transaminase
VVPPHCKHNAHMYYILTESVDARTRVIARLKGRGIHAVFHYVPLHSAPAGRKFGRVSGSMHVTDSIADRIVRLPLWVGLSGDEIDRIVEEVAAATT